MAAIHLRRRGGLKSDGSAVSFIGWSGRVQPLADIAIPIVTIFEFGFVHVSQEAKDGIEISTHQLGTSSQFVLHFTIQGSASVAKAFSHSAPAFVVSVERILQIGYEFAVSLR